MYLEKLELQGFKSFADKTTLKFTPSEKEGGFRHGITAIVGPNGSGKSNIADAVRWVMGTQSIKQIRGKKSEDVIFSGSDKRPRMGMAEVELFINNEDGGAPIDYKELIIGRKLYRNGDSEYLINKNKARLSDIQMMLAKANMGQRTYSVIGQGMIDSVLIATPQERKEFFDEAAGVKQFQIKRDQSVNKLEASEENLAQAEALISEIEPRMRSLTRQVKRLERREEVEKELREKQITYYGSEWQELNSKYKNYKSQFDQLETGRAEKEKAVREIQEKLGKLEKQESGSSAFDALQRNYEKLINERAKLREQEMLLKSRIEVQKRMEEKAPSAMPLEDIVKALEEVSGLQDKLLGKIKSAESLADLEALKYQASEISEKSKELLENIKNPAKRKKIEIDPKLLREVDEIAEKIEFLNKKAAELQAEMSKFHREEEKKKGTFFDLQRQFQTKQMELNDITNKVNDVKIELARLETKKEDLEEEIKEELKDVELVTKSKEKYEGIHENLWSDIQKLKHQLELIGGIDEETVAEYKETKERYDFLTTQSEDLKNAITALEKVIEELDETIQKQFMYSFNQINKEFEKYFKVLFNGGKASLVIQKGEQEKEKNLDEEETDEIQEEESICERVKRLKKSKLAQMISGIEVQASPPGKKLRNISMLSGGERALTSIALICAIISNNPAPFVVLDEVDAALDESNSIRFAEIIDELSKKTQFIVITHNRYTMEKSDVLYGVTMGDDGVSQLLSIKLEEAAKWSSK